MDLDTIVGSRIHTAIRVGNLFIPANSISETLRAYTEPAIFHSKGQERQYSLSISGSLTKIRIGERFFGLITQHQISSGNYEFDQLCIANIDSETVSTSSAVVTGSPDFDCLLFEFTKPVIAGKLQRIGWYDLTSELNVERLPKPKLICTVGYPGHRNYIDYSKKPHLGMAPNIVWGMEARSSISKRLAFTPEHVVDFKPNGMSGSPVFGCCLEVSDSNVFFAGILTNASKRKFHFLSRSRIRFMLNHALNM